MTEKSNQPRNPKRRASKKGRGGARRGSGRPAFRPSIEQRQTVEEMKFCGDADEVIARAIGIDVATLKKHFEDELLHGYAQRRKEVVSMMFKEARAGNASAIRRLEEIGRMANAASETKPAETPTAKAGKKETQHAAAQAVGGIFSPPPAPKLIAANGQIVSG